MILLFLACANSDKAETYAAEWAATYRPGWSVIAGPDCEHSDSDGDGRVRCNLTIEKDGTTENPPIACPAGWLPQPFTTACQTVSGR